ncbi:O-antigen ligase family protein [Patescibacteria group bacterium]|nr:O-antigen ligase family protein [Patescibacteria group bacterium]
MGLTFIKIKEYLFYSLVFLLPWQTRWIVRDAFIKDEVWEYGRLSLYAWDILLVFLFLLVIPEAVKIIKNFWHNFKFKNTQLPQPATAVNFVSKSRELIFVSYLSLLLLSFFTIIWAPDKLLAAIWSIRFLEIGLLWLLVLIIKTNLIKFGLSFIGAGFIQALWAIGQFAWQGTFASKWLGVADHPLFQPGSSVILATSGRWLRAYAGQVHPNVLGGLLVIGLLFTVYLLIDCFYKKEYSQCRVWLLMVYVVQLAGLFFTFSRGAWLALFITLFVWWWFKKDNRLSLTKFSVVAIVSFIILGLAAWPPVSGRLLGGSRLEQQSVEERVGSVEESRTMLVDYWWQGVGLGNYTKKLQIYQPTLKAYKYQPVHNLWLLILTEIGTVGLILFLFIWYLFWRFSSSFFSKLLFLPIIITGLVDHYWWTIPSMFLLGWLIISLNFIEE